MNLVVYVVDLTRDRLTFVRVLKNLMASECKYTTELRAPTKKTPSQLYQNSFRDVSANKMLQTFRTS
jgi:hypothetical protein